MGGCHSYEPVSCRMGLVNINFYDFHKIEHSENHKSDLRFPKENVSNPWAGGRQMGGKGGQQVGASGHVGCHMSYHNGWYVADRSCLCIATMVPHFLGIES